MSNKLNQGASCAHCNGTGFRIGSLKCPYCDRRTPAATTGELPKKMSWLDAPHDIQNDHANAWSKGWNACRAAIEADRDQRQVAPASAQPADPQPRLIDRDTAQAYMEETLWAFIECAGNFPEIAVDPRTWPHVLVYAPKADAQPDQRESAAVPRAPTSEMIRAGMRYFHDKRYPATEAWRCYKDMLAAAPSPAAQPVAKDETCAWTEHPEDGYWRTACGRDWVIIDGTPTDHDMQHCHGCGKKLVQGQDSANNGAEGDG